MAALLAPEELPVLDLGELRSMINTKGYGSPGPQSILNTTLRDASTRRSTVSWQPSTSCCGAKVSTRIASTRRSIRMGMG